MTVEVVLFLNENLQEYDAIQYDKIITLMGWLHMYHMD